MKLYFQTLWPQQKGQNRFATRQCLQESCAKECQRLEATKVFPPAIYNARTDIGQNWNEEIKQLVIELDRHTPPPQNEHFNVYLFPILDVVCYDWLLAPSGEAKTRSASIPWRSASPFTPFVTICTPVSSDTMRCTCLGVFQNWPLQHSSCSSIG